MLRWAINVESVRQHSDNQSGRLFERLSVLLTLGVQTPARYGPA